MNQSMTFAGTAACDRLASVICTVPLDGTTLSPGALDGVCPTSSANGSSASCRRLGVSALHHALCGPRVCCECINGSFSFTKVNASAAGLPGATYQLSNACDTFSATSDANGKVSFSGIRPGNYTMTETIAPTGYAPNERTYAVLVLYNGSVFIDNIASATFAATPIVNMPMVTEVLRFNVASNTGIPLAGATFTLSPTTTGMAKSAVSNTAGRVEFTQVQPGSYLLAEAKAPAGYTRSTVTFPVVAANNGTLTIGGQSADSFSNYTFHNTANAPREGNLTFRSTTADGAPLVGATFALSAPDPRNNMQAVSNSAGRVNFTNMRPGSYTLSQRQAPQGYTPSPATFAVQYSAGSTVMVDGKPASSFANYAFISTPDPMGDTLSFLVDDKQNNMLPGAQFAVMDNAGPQRYTAISDASGRVTFPEMMPGSYTLMEVKSPSGYLVSPKTFQIMVNRDRTVTVEGKPASQFYGYTFHNPMNYFYFYKTDHRDMELPGAVFQLQNEQGENMYSATSNASGRVEFKKLPKGIYALRETRAPSGYEPDDNTHVVEVDDHGEISINNQRVQGFYDEPFINYPIRR